MDVGTAVASAWSSGISMYGVAALLGIAGRLGWAEAPSFLERPWVIATALALFLVELVVDKVPLLDSTWDALHTAIRPAAGALLLASADAATAPALLGVAGGALALSAHAAKASTRALVNTSPEPVSNIVVSASEDGLVGALMALALAFPLVALGVTVVLAVASTAAAVVMFRLARRVARRLRRDAHP